MNHFLSPFCNELELKLSETTQINQPSHRSESCKSLKSKFLDQCVEYHQKNKARAKVSVLKRIKSRKSLIPKYDADYCKSPNELVDKVDDMGLDKFSKLVDRKFNAEQKTSSLSVNFQGRSRENHLFC